METGIIKDYQVKEILSMKFGALENKIEWQKIITTVNLL
jgi:hypothetical protein